MDQSVVLRPWERALAAFVDSVGGRLRWMLVGSAATAAQGAAVKPGDVDILVHPETSETTMREELAQLAAYAAASATGEDLRTFTSTRERPLFATANGWWLFGRWTVDDCKVEVARIREPATPDLLLETQGTAVWGCREHVQWRGRSVPVVPLEVQLATIVGRGLVDREQAVRDRLAQTGIREALLRRAFLGRGLG